MEPDLFDTDRHPLPDPGLGGILPGGPEEWALIRYVGSPVGEVVSLRGERFRIGRSPDNDLSLPEPEISRGHALLRRQAEEEGGGLELLDLGSTNGTWVNGQRLACGTGRVRLQHGDVLRIGSHAFKLKRLDDLERHYHQEVLAQTTRDPLTGVANRVTVLGALERHFDVARRYGRPLTLILADLDHFKAVNDTHGHAAGDRVLQRFGVLLTTRLRGGDQAGRIGGEEFLVVLPETGAREGRRVAEDLRKALAGEALGLPDGRTLQVTCSLGVAQLQDGDGSGGDLLARADAALYRAKKAGRDLVVVNMPEE